MATIYPSLLAANQKNLETTVKQLEPHCNGFHIDIMDGKFVPNRGISVETTNMLAEKTFRQLWIHLMVEKPNDYIDKLKLPANSIVTFHIESNKKIPETISRISEKKWLPGLAINPKSGINEVFPFLAELYQVLIMSVNPGFAGQQFIKDTIDKIDPIQGYRSTKSGFNATAAEFKIAMDGGINLENIELVVQKGVDQLAIGSALFNAPRGPVETLKIISEKIRL